MKESISNALLFNLVITFVIVLLGFFIGSLSYSKAAKVKTKIIEEIEKNGEIAGMVTSDSEVAKDAFNKSKAEIEAWLKSGGNDGKGIGYRITQNGWSNCPEKIDNAKGKLINHDSNYEYCVYMINTCVDAQGKIKNDKDKCGIYYHVITYMYFDVPIVGDIIRIPLHGETRVFTIKNN